MPRFTRILPIALRSGWDHIDWNHENNNRDNLIWVHQVVHETIHLKGAPDRKSVLRLVKIFNLSKIKSEVEIKDLLDIDPDLLSMSDEENEKLDRLPHPKYDRKTNASDQISFEFLWPFSMTAFLALEC